MIKAAFFDVDGTLLSHKTKRIPESTREVLRKLREKGILCVIATGRQMGEMEKLPMGELAVDGYLTLNGQLILDADKRILHGVPIRGRAKENLLRMFAEHTLPILMVEQERVFLNFADERVARVQERISTPIPPLGDYDGGEIYQACAYLNEGDEVLLEPIAEDCVITQWGRGGVDIIAKGGGKVTGIQWYLTENGLRPEEIIAFGDGENDREMLRFAGIGVAMGNAEESVKQCADYVTADIDEDGIALALKHFGILE